jgi:DNA primase
MTQDFQNVPSAIDTSLLESWLDKRSSKLGEYLRRGSKHGAKYLINSPWRPDVKKHTALFPEMGRYGRYRDYKSGKSGSLVDFVMEVEGIGFREAKDLLVSIDDGYRRRDAAPPPARIPLSIRTNERRWSLKIPDNCIRVTAEHAEDHRGVARALEYMTRRMIDPTVYEAYYCEGERHVGGRKQNLDNRVLLAFRDWNGELWYWTARTLSDLASPRYLEPTQSEGAASKEEVLFCPGEWDLRDKAVLVCEGPVDAISIKACGLRAVATQGSCWYRQQQDALVEFGIKPVFAFDHDQAGTKALLEAAESWEGQSYYVFAPEGMDWNDALRAMGKEALAKHVAENVLPVDERTVDMLQWNIASIKGGERSKVKERTWRTQDKTDQRARARTGRRK